MDSSIDFGISALTPKAGASEDDPVVISSPTVVEIQNPPSRINTSPDTKRRKFSFRRPTMLDRQTMSYPPPPTSDHSEHEGEEERSSQQREEQNSDCGEVRTDFNSAFLEDVDVDDGGDDDEDADSDTLNTSITDNLSDLRQEDNTQRRVFLLTYSKADLKKFPTRRSFGRAVVQAFGGNKVSWLAVAMETHPTTGGYHYHAAVRCSKVSRWLYAKNNLTEQHGIVVNFKESPDGGFYHRVFKYISKSDTQIVPIAVLEGHPKTNALQNVIAERANQKYVANRADARREAEAAEAAAVAADSAAGGGKGKSKKEKQPRLNLLNVAMIIRNGNIQTETELFAAAEDVRRADDGQLAQLVMRMGEKRRKELIRDSWRLARAGEEVLLQRKSRLDILKEYDADRTNCCCESLGTWLALAIDLCGKNNMNYREVGGAIYRCLVEGRKKHNNIIITGESNCGKTFLLEPLNKIFENVMNSPASSVFGWLGVDTAQVIYLNDFRWVNPVSNKQGLITWDAFLRLLEGNNCALPAPMNSHSKHLNLSRDNDVPILCTSRDIIRYYEQRFDEPQSNRHASENRMMIERWHEPIQLTHQFSEDEKAVVEPCGWCFCRFIMPSA